MSPSPLLLPALAVANFAIGVGGFAPISVISPMAEGLSMSAGEAGLVMTVFSIAYALGSPICVALTGAMPRRAVLTLGLALAALGAAGTAMAGSVEALWAARVVAALGGGMITPVAAGVAAASAPPERRGKAMATAFLGMTAAQVLGVPLGAYMGYTFGWESVFWAAAALGLIGLAGIIMFVPGDAPFHVNSLATLVQALGDWRATFTVLLTTSFLGSIYIVYTYTAPILENGMGWGRDGVSLYFLVAGIGAVIGNFVGGRVVDRIGSRATLILVISVVALCNPVFSLLPMPEIVLLTFAFILAAFGWAMMVPHQIRLIAMAPERQSVTLALNASALYFGASLGSAIGAAVIELWGLEALGVAAAIGCGIALLHFLASDRMLRAA